MSEPARNVLPGGGTISITGRDARALIAARDGNAALLYLHILTVGGALSYPEAAKALGCSEGEISRAMEVLASLGLVEVPAAPVRRSFQREELPEYSAADIHRELQSGTAFSALVDEVQRVYGKLLSSDGLRKLFGIYDSLGLPPEVILVLLTHCIEEYQRKNGTLRLPSMGYVEKAAFTWSNAGVSTLEQAEAYLQAMDRQKNLISELKRLLGIHDRALSPTEAKYLEKWAGMGFPLDCLSLAYDRTVMQTGKLAWRYMDSILTRWQEKGLFTLEAIESGDAHQSKRSPQPASMPAPTQTPSELDDLRRFIDSI